MPHYKYFVSNPFNLFSYSLMYKCWKFSPDERPNFETLSSSFEEVLHSVSGYLELKMVLKSKGIEFFSTHSNVRPISQISIINSYVKAL